MKVGDIVFVHSIEFDLDAVGQYIGKIGEIKYICNERETFKSLCLYSKIKYFEFGSGEQFCPIAVKFDCFESEEENSGTFRESELLVISSK